MEAHPITRRRGVVIARIVLAMCVAAGGILLGAFVFRNHSSSIELPVRELVVGDDDLTVTAVVDTNSCGEPQRLVLDETDTEVRVTAQVGQRSGVCEDVAIPHQLSGTLSAPLAGRALVAG